MTKVGPGTLSVASNDNTTPFVVSAGRLRSVATASGNGGFGTGPITLQGGATISGAMPASNTLTFGNALTVPTGQTGNINATDRFNWTGTVSGGGTLNVNVISTQTRHDFNSDWTNFTGKLNLTGTGTARLFINGGNFDVADEWTNTSVDLGESVTISPVTDSTGNNIPMTPERCVAHGDPGRRIGGLAALCDRWPQHQHHLRRAGHRQRRDHQERDGDPDAHRHQHLHRPDDRSPPARSVLGTTAQEPDLRRRRRDDPGLCRRRGGKIAFKYEGDASALVVLVSQHARRRLRPDARGSPHGAIRSSTITDGRVLGWRNNAADSQVEVAYTLAGDANLDFGVDFNDLVALAQNYNYDGTRSGRTATPTTTARRISTNSWYFARTTIRRCPLRDPQEVADGFEADLAPGASTCRSPRGCPCWRWPRD